MSQHSAVGARPGDQSPTNDFVVRQQCPGCGSADFQEIFSCPFESPLLEQYLARHYGGLAQLERMRGKEYAVCRCGRCTLLFQPLAPAGHLLQEIYDCWIPAITPRQIYESDDLQSARYRLDQVDFLIQTTGLPPSGIRFLDFGSGWSEWLCVARAFGCDVAGAELSRARLEYAATLGIPMLGWDDIAERRFNIINLEQVLEHLVDPREVLAHLRDALDPDGVIRVSVPDGRPMIGRLRSAKASAPVESGYLMPVQPLEHLNCFTHASLAAIGESTGLRVLKPSLRKLYDSVSGWCSFKGVGRNLLRPIYRHVFPKSTIVYFVRA